MPTIARREAPPFDAVTDQRLEPNGETPLRETACDGPAAVSVTHAEVEAYAERLRRRCDRMLAVCRN